MNEPWIHPGRLGGILGDTMGTLGAITGTLAGWFPAKGKYKKLVLGVNIFSFVLSLILLVIGGNRLSVWSTSWCMVWIRLLWTPWHSWFRYRFRDNSQEI